MYSEEHRSIYDHVFDTPPEEQMLIDFPRRMQSGSIQPSSSCGFGEYGKFADTRLRDVPTPVFEQYKDRLPANFRKHAEHYFSEYRRVEGGAEGWRKGDLETYGKLIFESGKSSVEN